MRGGRLVVPVLLALAGLGWAAAHAFAHDLGMPETGMRGAPEMQGYASYLPTSLALCLALALPLAAGATLGKRWKGTSARTLWFFGVVPVLGFLGHTLGEPLILGSGTSSGLAEIGPMALVGLLVQIPFALVAVGLAHRVLWLAEGLARALAGPRSKLSAREPERPAHPHPARPATFSVDPSRSPRAPPSRLLA